MCMPPLNVSDLERLIGDEHNDYILLGRGSVLHRLAFWKPYKAAGAESTFMRYQDPLQHVHTMRTRMRM